MSASWACAPCRQALLLRVRKLSERPGTLPRRRARSLHSFSIRSASTVSITKATVQATNTTNPVRPADPLEQVFLSRVRQGTAAAIPLSEQAAEGSAPDFVTPRLAQLRMQYKGNIFTEEQREDFLNRIARAKEQRNLGWFRLLWVEIQRYRDGTSPLEQLREDKILPVSAHTKTIPISLYKTLVQVAAHLQVTDTGKEIYADFIKSEHRNDVEIWQARLDAAATLRDAEEVERIWKEMEQKGVMADTASWAARMRGLIASRKWDHGMAVLREMTTVWETALRQHLNMKPNTSLDPATCQRHGDIDGVVKPDTLCLNTVVAELLDARRRNFVTDVLIWARKIGIKQDLYTYNTRLKLVLLKKYRAGAIGLMQEMDDAQMKPDVVTYSTLLGGTLRDPVAFGFKDADVAVHSILDIVVAQQGDGAVTLLGALVEHTLNWRLYAQSREDMERNRAVALSIIDYMNEHKLPVSSGLYGNIALSFFEVPVAVEPNYEALDLLLGDMEVQKIDMDCYYYERMILALVKRTQLERAYSLVRKMRSEGKGTSWNALQRIGMYLVRTKNYAELSAFVQEVCRDKLGTVRTDELALGERLAFEKFIQNCQRDRLLPSDVALPALPGM